MRDDYQTNNQSDAVNAHAEDAPRDLTAGANDKLAEEAGSDSVEDPAWRLTAWVLPIGAGAAALLTAAQTAEGGLGALG